MLCKAFKKKSFQISSQPYFSKRKCFSICKLPIFRKFTPTFWETSGKKKTLGLKALELLRISSQNLVSVAPQDFKVEILPPTPGTPRLRFNGFTTRWTGFHHQPLLAPCDAVWEVRRPALARPRFPQKPRRQPWTNRCEAWVHLM